MNGVDPAMQIQVRRLSRRKNNKSFVAREEAVEIVVEIVMLHKTSACAQRGGYRDNIPIPVRKMNNFLTCQPTSLPVAEQGSRLYSALTGSRLQSVRGRWIRRDPSFLPTIITICGSSLGVRRVLSREMPPLSVVLTQPVQELGKLHLAGNEMSGHVKRYRAD